ncbi:hypothetical protein JOC70_000339 [Clostridium pascui]|uniref:hypothetical protein n=1 Tax=Clostridium pascui TaxID=46609 RepID=UPI00195E102D|nr:hypothetical protein [Clostridium pascui]MBM7868870.1 hypothetical protein [Clostridium pascui]
MLNMTINTKSISIDEINQLKNESEILKGKLVYFIEKYMEIREVLGVLKKGLDIIESCEEEVQQLKDKLFWSNELKRLYREGWGYQDALEVVRLEKDIQKILRKKIGIII